MSREAMKQALDALGYVMSHGAQVQIAKDILTQAIEQAEKQKPVSWMHNFITNNVITHIPADIGRHPERWTPLYTAPPKREWVGLADDEIYDCEEEAGVPQYEISSADLYAFARAIEAKLKDKNA